MTLQSFLLFINMTPQSNYLMH